MKLLIVLILTSFSSIILAQDAELSDTSSHEKGKWIDGFRVDLNASPGSQKQLIRETTPVGKIIEESYTDNFLLISGGINYRNNLFLVGAETFGTHLNGFVVGGNAFFWNWDTPEINIFPTFRYGWSRKGRLDVSSNPYWGLGLEFYIDNIHIGITQLNRSYGSDQPNVLRRSNLLLFIGYSFNRNSFKKK